MFKILFCKNRDRLPPGVAEGTLSSHISSAGYHATYVYRLPPGLNGQASAASEETDGKAPGGRFEAERRFEHVSSDERWFRAILGGQSYGLVDWGLG